MLYTVRYEGYLDGSLSWDFGTYEATSPEDALAQAKADYSLGWIGGGYTPPTYEIVEVK